MLSVDLLGRTPEQFRKLSKQKVIAVYSFHFDKHLVPDLLANLDGMVDGFIAFDDSGSNEVFSSEPARRKILVKKAIELGADWVFAVDPDERFEPALREKMHKMISVWQPTIWSFDVRELYNTTAYRSDGSWNKKQVFRLFPVNKRTRFDDNDLHGSWIHVGKNFRHRRSGINLYHLKSISPARRKGRRDLYSALDIDRKFNAPGYDYLIDETGLELTEIPENRMYSPPHVEDGGLWMRHVENIHFDPPSIALKRAASLRKSGNIAGSIKILENTSMHFPEGPERDLYVARMKFRMGAYAESQINFEAVYQSALPMPVEDQVKMIECATILEQDHVTGLLDQLILKNADTWEINLAVLRHRPPIGETALVEAFKAAGWTEETVSVSWGSAAHYKAEIATIVIGLNAPSELRDAVESLLEQSADTLVVVVNSGSGNLKALLKGLLSRVIIAETPSRINVGSARNIGASLVKNKNVAFLASDCIAEEKSVENRLKHHENGHSLVSSSLTNSHPNSVLAWAYHFTLYVRRLSDTKPEHQLFYGLSYERGLLFSHDWFPHKLRISEDSLFNSRVEESRQPFFARDVSTTHRAETNFFKIIFQMFKRGQRSARHAPILTETKLKAINLLIPFLLIQNFIAQPINRLRFQLKVRQGLPHPKNADASQVGLYISFFCFAANNLGRFSMLHQEMLARFKAYKLQKKCSQKNDAIPTELILSVKNTGYLGPAVLKQLSKALYAAGYDDNREFEEQ